MFEWKIKQCSENLQIIPEVRRVDCLAIFDFSWLEFLLFHTNQHEILPIRQGGKAEPDWHIKYASDILHYSWWIIFKNWRKCILCRGWWRFMYFFNIWEFYVCVRVEFLKFIFFRFFPNESDAYATFSTYVCVWE